MKILIDKQAHFLAGVSTSSILFIVFHNLILSILITVFVAAGKELWDLFSKRGTPDFKDFSFTMLGTIPTLIAVLLRSLF